MDAKNIFNKIATLVGVQKEVNLSFGGDEYGKLKDGGAVATDAFEVGHVLFVINEDGSKVLAPDAEHKIFVPTQNGSKLFNVVTADGIITQMELQPNPGKELNMKKEELAMVDGPNGEKVKEVSVEGPKPEMDKEVDTEKVSMQEGEDMASRVDALQEQVKQLREDIASLFDKEENMKKMAAKMEELGLASYNEESQVKDILKNGVGALGQGKPNDGGPSKQNMSSQKKFTGAPKEEAKQFEKPLVNYSKNENSINKVFAKMANSKF
jgi:hypothetical protein